MKIYTRKGDDGTTGLCGGGRVPKDSAAPEAYGTVDEAQAFLGVARAHAVRGSVLEDGRGVPNRGCSRPAIAQLANSPPPAAAKIAGKGATNSKSHAAPGVRIPETSRKLE